jgi:DNA-binding response OmpR family regulator
MIDQCPTVASVLTLRPALCYVGHDMTHQPVAAGLTILIVEDDPDIRDLLAVALEGEGYAVATAADGVEALNLTGEKPINLVLLDLNLPRLDGEGFCRVYRERGGAAPVVLVTAASAVKASAAVEACGAVGLIAKPFQVPDLLATVARHLALAR